MKLEKLLNSKDALVELSNKDIPISIGFKIKKIMDEYNLIEDLYKEKVRGLYKEYGVEVEGQPDTFKIPSDSMDIFNEKVEEIHNEEVLEDIEDKKIDLSDLLKSNLSIKPITLFTLDWLIQD